MNEKRRHLLLFQPSSNATALIEDKAMPELIDYSNKQTLSFVYFDTIMDIIWIVLACVVLFCIIYTLIKCFCKKNKNYKRHLTTIPLVQTNFNEESHIEDNENKKPHCTICKLIIEQEENILFGEAKQPLLTLPCGHSFHYKCITVVIQTNHSCPLCNIMVLGR